MNFTPLTRWAFVGRAESTDSWADKSEEIQERMLLSLLRRGAGTEVGREYDFGSLLRSGSLPSDFANRVRAVEYEDIRPQVMRMIAGEKDVLWRGECRDFAQSSGTSGGKSKFIPITGDSLRRCHFGGAFDSVAHYLRNNPGSRMFAGKGFILGGSFANELNLSDPRVHVGDLSATLIARCPVFAQMFRIPSRETALMADWSQKLPKLIDAASRADVTNISGVPSWFLAVIKGILEKRHTDNLHDVWPNLEVFFHGGISFEPYRNLYRAFTDPTKMHFYETYNASEGFFATQDTQQGGSMLLILDRDVYYEFIPLGGSPDDAVGIGGVEQGRVYEMMITSSNGLWRYRLGDTVRIETTHPVRITVAGRTKRFINAFGEELMEDNAEKAMAEACLKNGCQASNYTVAPVYADNAKHGRHQWLIEWVTPPADRAVFAADIDAALRRFNSDYDAKRAGKFFLDAPEIVSLKPGVFRHWLESVGNQKLGGQRKVPRLSNDRAIADHVLAINAAL